MSWEVDVSRVWYKRNAQTVLVRKHEGKGPLAIPTPRWQFDNKMLLKGIER
jgi:hypothetical protein